MEDITRGFTILSGVFLILLLVLNLMPKWQKFPGDLYINKFGLSLYIPWLSSIVLSVLLILILNFTRR